MSRLLKFDVSAFDAIYEYTDEEGRHLSFVWRLPGKKFKQARLSDPGDESSSLVGNVKGVRRVLYMLPWVLHALESDSTIYIPEGEKDVHAVMRAGRTATCSPGGAGKWRSDDAEVFRGTRSPIAIVADNDKAGLRHASQVYYSLRDVGVRGKLGIFVAKTGNDITDHLEAGHELEELVPRKPLSREEAGLAPRPPAAGTPKAPSSELSPRMREVLKKLNARSTGPNQWSALCPAHDDKTPSLSVSVGASRPVLVHCHAGCETAEIARALGMKPRDFSERRTGPTPLSSRPISTFPDERVTWLWPGRIPFGKLTILGGDPGLAKSTMTLEFAALLSTDRAFPFGQPVGPAQTLLVVAEDDAADTVRPRLIAARADVSRVHIIEPERDDEGKVLATALPKDTLALRLEIEKLNARFVVIDPITAYLEEDVNTHNDASVRRALFPLAQVAQDTGAAILLVRHLNKASGQSALYRGGGSIGFTATARSELVVARHPTQPKLLCLASIKSNLGPTPPTLTYTIEVEETLGVPFIGWGGPVDLDANALLRGPDSRLDAPKRKAAEAFLLDVLAKGPVSGKEVERRGQEEGHSPSTLRRAKKSLGVLSRQVRSEDGNLIREWEWYLPDPADEEDS